VVRLILELSGLRDANGSSPRKSVYDLDTLRQESLPWDRVVKSTHLTNCWYQRACNFNLYVKDGVVLREEQVGNYPAPNDPAAPDPNPRGCQKGVCYAQRMYDPTRIRYPLKRIGERGDRRWQRLSWDQALSEISDVMLDILTTEGPEAVVQAGGTRVYSQASEGLGPNALFEALGCASPSPNVEIGDDHQGAAITAGKIMFADSADNWLYADLILVWGGNPAYTNIPNFHYLAEARYRGTRVIAISPDYNASAVHADLWIPVNVGSDAALALALAQTILREELYRKEFVQEQTDLPLLVRDDNGSFLREKDLKQGGRDDIFYCCDETSGRVVEAPRRNLALNGVTPALAGSYPVQTLSGKVTVRPFCELLRQHLNRNFTPQQASLVTGVAAQTIESLAREIATAGGVVNMPTSNWGRFYHGDLIERAIILVFALCGHMGRKGASYNAFPALTPDTAQGALERHGHQTLMAALSNDPRFATWKEDGYTDEMILYEYTKQAVANGAVGVTAMFHYIHGGLLDLSKQHNSWDPCLKRSVGDYVDEALAKRWQIVAPPPQRPPRALFQIGGNIFRRGRGTNQLLGELLPKLKLLVTVDWRMSATALYSDYLLPTCGWYERTSTSLLGSTNSPFMQVNAKAVEPLYESLSDWAISVRLARSLAERAAQRKISSFKDKDGKERRFDRLVDAVTCGGIYEEEDEEGVARDAFVNCANVEPIGWEEFKERGIAAYTSVGSGVRCLGNACDIEIGEPIVPLTWHTAKKQPYPTLTRRLQFYIDHDWYKELGEHLPTHKDCPMAGGNYPLQLTGGHARWSVHSDWVDDALMLAMQRGEPIVQLSPQDAAKRNVRTGGTVVVYNDVGDCQLGAVVSPAVRPGQVIIYHAWENYQFPGWHHFKGVMASPLNPIELVGNYGHIRPDVVSLSAGPNDRGTRVEVRCA
jgi:DMSO reductase family type II enzyme molybdopterin subunit